MPIPNQVKYFTPTGRMQAEKLVADILSKGGQARIDMTWEDYGAGIMTETVLNYSRSLNMWCQALSPADINAMNSGGTPNGYSQMLERAVR